MDVSGFIGMPGPFEILIGLVCLAFLAALVAVPVILLTVGRKPPGDWAPCPDCGQQVSRMAECCPHCGRPLLAPPE